MPNTTTRPGFPARPVAAALLLMIAGPMAHAAAPADTAAEWNRPAELHEIAAIENRITDPAKSIGLADVIAKNAVVLGAFSPGIYQGREKVLQAYAERNDHLGNSHPKITEMSIVSTGRFACSALEVRYEPGAGADGKYPTEFRQLDAFKKVDGHWQLVQQQISAPVDTATASVVKVALPIRGGLDWRHSTFDPDRISSDAARKGINDWTDQALRVIGIGPALHFFGPGPDVLLYGEYYPGSIRGSEEIRKYYGPIMNSYTSIDVKNPVYSVDTDGMLGAQIDTQALLLHMNDGTRKSISIRQSDCLRRVNGSWHSFLEMVSFPIDRQTGKAVM